MNRRLGEFDSFCSIIRMTKTLHFDCLSGISGDMTLGALIDLGVSVDQIQQGLQSLNLPDLKLRTEEVKKCGFRAVQIHIDHPPEKAHRHLHHIDAMIDEATEINESAKALAKKIFLCVGEAEAKVHGCSLRKVHFHEVGAIDSIADIVGVAIAIDALDIEHATSSTIPTGTGAITIDHGRGSRDCRDFDGRTVDGLRHRIRTDHANRGRDHQDAGSIVWSASGDDSVASGLWIGNT